MLHCSDYRALSQEYWIAHEGQKFQATIRSTLVTSVCIIKIILCIKMDKDR